MSGFTYMDLFAGAGGLSEGFIRQGFSPIGHVEYDQSACFTLKTRAVYHYLKEVEGDDLYYSYLKGDITRNQLYASVPPFVLESIVNAEIGKDNELIFDAIDSLLKGRQIDVIVGGPPCQAYSSIVRGVQKHRGDDERKTLYIHYGRFLKKYKPKIFVFENVPGLFSIEGGRYFKNLRKYYRRLGYEVDHRTLNAYDYGVVQNRERVIIIGWRKELEFTYPEAAPVESRHYRDEIFYDLPHIEPGESARTTRYTEKANNYLNKTFIRNGVNFVSQHITRVHNDKDLEIYKLAIQKLLEGERLKNNTIPEHMRTQKNVTDFLDRFKVVGTIPHTMIAHIAKDGHHFIYPDINQLRSISVREAARIQSFPDNYYFEGVIERQPRTAAFRQIGNAVPPLMAEKIAEKINDLLCHRQI